MKALIIVAMESELNGFLAQYQFERELVCGIPIFVLKKDEKVVYLAKSEVGKVNAAILTTTLILKLKPQYVINAGIAGGLNPSIHLLDIVASTKVAYHDFDLCAFGYLKGEMDNHQRFFNASKKLLSLLDNDVKKGLVLSGDTFVSGIEKLNEIKKDFPKGLICDMEGGAIAHVCTLLSRRFLILRAVSDNVFLDNHVSIYQDYKPLAIKKIVTYTMSLIDKI